MTGYRRLPAQSVACHPCEVSEQPRGSAVQSIRSIGKTGLFSVIQAITCPIEEDNGQSIFTTRALRRL